MSKTYGFNYSGVINKSVFPPSLEDDRVDIPGINENNLEITNKIFKYLQNGHNIKIITSTTQFSNIKEILKSYLENLPGYNKSMISKITVEKVENIEDKVKESDIIEFYEASYNILVKIINKLGTDISKKKIFLVRTELNDYIQITSIEQLNIVFIKFNILMLLNKDIIIGPLKYNINKLLVKISGKVSGKVSGIRRINIFGTIYQKGSSDFKIIIKKFPSNKLFIYNENREQFLDKSDLGSGSGNGFLRIARLDYKGDLFTQIQKKNEEGLPLGSRSLGIPTDVLNNKDHTIDQSISQIYNEISGNQDITDVYYSISKEDEQFMDIGLQTFSAVNEATENIKFISIKLREMFRKLTESFEVHFYVLEFNSTEEISLDDPRIKN